MKNLKKHFTKNYQWYSLGLLVVVVALVAAVYGKVDGLDRDMSAVQMTGSLKYAAPKLTYKPTYSTTKEVVMTKVTVNVMPKEGAYVICSEKCRGNDSYGYTNILHKGSGVQTFSLFKGTYEIRPLSDRYVSNISKPYSGNFQITSAEIGKTFDVTTLAPQKVVLEYPKWNVVNLKFNFSDVFAGSVYYLQGRIHTDVDIQYHDYIHARDVNPFTKTYYLYDGDYEFKFQSSNWFEFSQNNLSFPLSEGAEKTIEVDVNRRGSIGLYPVEVVVNPPEGRYSICESTSLCFGERVLIEATGSQAFELPAGGYVIKKQDISPLPYRTGNLVGFNVPLSEDDNIVEVNYSPE